ncbi:virulence factor TspB C-terminal domain-related protein [Vibrio sp. THAF190c]|uniref:virulence factor TspB C-terminal domain-related protein n=1 Tax=Vibrio sp. THAF190c TaxID=2587865 RepID=UPI0012A9F908|nr:virulence factor TspB C-terminal domain-related protein [Vibrio sp. THAF190c]QFT09734.1 hypothetical protein FIV04_07110 [Vibrio sp. THAF190c]
MKGFLLVFFLLFCFSHSANARLIKILGSGQLAHCGYVNKGDVINSATYCKGVGEREGYGTCVVDYMWISGGYVHPFYSAGSCGNSWIRGGFISSCPEGTTLSETTGKCEEPDFCGSSQWVSLVASQSNACAAQYPDFYTDFSSTCVSKNDYSFTCKQGAPKPPTGGDGGSGGDGSGGDGSGGDGSGGDGSGGDGSGGDGSGGDGSGGDGSGGGGSGGDGSGGGGSGGDGSGGDGSGGDGSGGDGSGGDGSGGDGSGGGGSGGDGSGGDGSGGGGSGGGGSGGGGSGSGGGGSGGGGSGGEGSVDLSGVITKINESNKLLNDLKTSSDSVGSAIGANGAKLDELGTKLDKLAEGSKTSASANNCQPNSFSCSGNAYECFIARQSWDNKCLIKSMTETEIDPTVETDAKRKITSSGDDLINSLESYNNEKLNPNLLSNGEQVLSDSLSKYDESNGFSFDDGCPSPINVAYGLGSFELNYQPFCDLALYIRAMLMLTASIASFLMIAKHS